MQKLLMIIFTENSSLGASMLCDLAQKHGWIVDIIFIGPNDKSKILESCIQTYHPDLIAFSFKSFERKQAFEVAEQVRKSCSIKMISGGIHSTLMPDDVMDSGFFDAVVVGDGMGVFENILDNYRQLDHQIIYGSPHPDQSRYTQYFHSESQKKRMRSTQTSTILSAIGCPYDCTFCYSGNALYQNFPIEQIAGYALELYETCGVRSFHFVDDLFANNIKRLQKFRKTIRNIFPDFKFSSQVSGRANTFSKKIAEEMCELGVETMNFGIETASPRLLTFLNKHQTPDDCYNAVKICHEFGLNCVINLMFGIPTENEDDYKYTLEFVKKAKPDSVNAFFYSPYPGTKLYDFCFDNGYLPKSFDRNKFDWFNPETDGISDIQLRFKKINYGLALEYREKINRAMNQESVLFEKMATIDKRPWVLIGTSRHFYFKTIMKKISSMRWENCQGYINLEPEAGFQLQSKDDELLPLYHQNERPLPFWFVTYSFFGNDYTVIEKKLEEMFEENRPLISISSFNRSHSNEDIENILSTFTNR